METWDRSRDSVLDLGTELNSSAGERYAIKRGQIIGAAEKYLIYKAGHESSKAGVLNLYQALSCCLYFGKVLHHVAAEPGLHFLLPALLFSVDEWLYVKYKREESKQTDTVEILRHVANNGSGGSISLKAIITTIPLISAKQSQKCKSFSFSVSKLNCQINPII